MSFLRFLCEICPVVETVLQNIRCFIVYIAIIVLHSFVNNAFLFLYTVSQMADAREKTGTRHQNEAF